MAEVGMFMNLAALDKETPHRRGIFESSISTPRTTFFPLFGEGKYQTYGTIAKSLVARSPAVLFASCYPTMWELQLAQPNPTIPIVYGGMIHPDGEKLIGKDGMAYYY